MEKVRSEAKNKKDSALEKQPFRHYGDPTRRVVVSKCLALSANLQPSSERHTPGHHAVACGHEARVSALPWRQLSRGNNMAERFNWKETIGDVSQRPGHRSPWGYWSTDGFGLLEFLEWCEDLHMEPVLGIFAGYTLDRKYLEPGLGLDPYVQEALEEIEYVNGDTNTKWGAQ